MFRAAAFALGLLTSSAAFGAVVQTVEGTVSLNQGNGYKRVAQTVFANSGDLVMASPGGSGKIVYADRCEVEVKPGTVVAVREQSPCKAGVAPKRRSYLIGGAVVVGGIAAIIALTSGSGSGGNNERPASP